MNERTAGSQTAASLPRGRLDRPADVAAVMHAVPVNVVRRRRSNATMPRRAFRRSRSRQARARRRSAIRRSDRGTWRRERSRTGRVVQRGRAHDHRPGFRLAGIAARRQNDAGRRIVRPFHLDLARIADRRSRLENFSQIALKAHQNRLRLGIAKAHVVFKHPRAVMRQHQTDEKNSAKRKAFVAARRAVSARLFRATTRLQSCVIDDARRQ